ncbi:unnamed protein product [Ostreobium quekettii]|uniref:Carrier domain-containing protein n=1 Tax=Ostreobium quekettii TaxID=121088 RepID=A0A8S1ITZ2_9CHLO|nr:unnamed protein product [Ostreobium quekettii]
MQVKVRGFRIELEEVESALSALSTISQAATSIAHDPHGDPHLVAYVAPENQIVERVKEQLGQVLPYYMVPSMIITLEKIPLLTSGKVDRKSLPHPVWTSDSEVVAPRTDLEYRIHEIWADVLGVEDISIHTDFFELGGDSLKAGLITAKLRQAFGVEVPGLVVFKFKTIATLSEAVEQVASDGGTLAALQRLGVTDASGIVLPKHLSSISSSAEDVDPSTGVPMSYGQEQMLTIQKLMPQTTAYSLPVSLYIKGPLDLQVLKQAFVMLTKRHQVLGMKFASKDGHTVMITDAHKQPDLHVLDTCAGSVAMSEGAAVADSTASEHLQHLASIPFDLEAGPAIRAALLPLANDEHVLMIMAHHAALDGWSTGILMREFCIAYNATVASETPDLEPLPIQYHHFAAWQRRWLGEGALEEHLKYWKSNLGGAPALLEIPTDKPRGRAITTAAAGHVDVEFPAAVVQQMKKLASECHATLFQVLLAAFDVLLTRYSRQTDIVVGTIVAGRWHPELVNLVGYVANPVPIRVEFPEQPTFRGLMGLVKRAALSAFDHSVVPIQKVIEAVGATRDASHHPVFQVIFNLQNLDLLSQQANITGCEVQPIPQFCRPPQSRFDLALELAETEGVVKGTFEFSTDLFELSTVARMASHLRKLVEGLLSSPDEPLGAISMLTSTEHDLLVRELPTEHCHKYDVGRECLHEMFHHHAEASPKSACLVFGDETMTYEEVEMESNRVAQHLIDLGVYADSNVGIMADKSLEMVIGILGILKSGAAYTPVDPKYPPQRTAAIVEDARIQIMLVHTRQDVESTLEGLPVQVVQVGCVPEQLSLYPSGRCFSGNLAYTIFTSGSTGRPKGVMVPHRAVVNFLQWMMEEFSLSKDDRYLQNIHFTFDLSMMEIWLALTSGATLILPDPEFHPEPSYVVDLIKRTGATFCCSVPSLLRGFADICEPQACPSLRVQISCGEVLPVPVAAKFLEKLPHCTLANTYGPTEATIHVTSQTVTTAELNGPLSIGRPLSHVAIYILDEGLQPVPIGVPGELMISGACLARGYIGRPELTGEKFLKNPFCPKGSADFQKMYRTGDLACWSEDGRLHILGRVDHQVKIRGFRIELEEVESALITLPTVSQATASIANDPRWDPHLVAYVTPEDQAIERLKEQVGQVLPYYMVPSIVIAMERMPLLPSGKVNRKALPQPVWTSTSEVVLPRNDLEQRVHEIWSSVLGVEDISIHTDFFDLGGDSLKAGLITAKLRQAFGVEVPGLVVFKYKTIATLCEAVEQVAGDGGTLAALKTLSVTDASGVVLPKHLSSISSSSEDANIESGVVMSYGQEQMFTIQKLMPQTTAYSLPVSLYISGHLELQALKQAFGILTARHQVLGVKFASKGEQTMMIRDPHQQPDLQVLEMSSGSIAVRDGSMVVDSTASERLQHLASIPFDLEAGPAIRAAVLPLATDEHVLMIMAHHAALDGWSTGILMREFCIAYNGTIASETPDLEPLPIQYHHFAAWQRRWLGEGALEEHLKYWKNNLVGAPALLEIPTDKPRGRAITTAAAGHVDVEFPAAVVQQMKKLASECHATLFQVLLAAFDVLLSRYSRQTDIVVGTIVAGRWHPELVNLVGYVANPVPIRVEFPEQLTFKDLMGLVKTAAMNAFDHSVVPIQKVIEAVGAARDASHHPLFQVIFNLQNLDLLSQEANMTGCEVHPIPEFCRPLESRFDLALELAETQGAVKGTFEFSTDLFNSATVARMASHFRKLVEGLVSHPDELLGKIPMLDAREHDRLVGEYAVEDCHKYAVGHECLHEMFHRQAEESPKSTCVLFKDQSMTYEEVEMESNRLAHHLIDLGVCADSNVGIMADKSLEMVIGILGILKSGAAYTPVDPKYPPQRTAAIVEDARIQIMLVHTRQDVESTLEGLPVQVVQVGCVPEQLSLYPSGRCFSGNLAYTIFTSGSTGRPKGVMVPHRAVVNFLQWMMEEFSLSKDDRYLQNIHFTFDLSMMEIWLALTSGATLILPDPEFHPEPSYVVDLIKRTGATFCCSVPSLLRGFADICEPQACPSLRVQISCGEVLPVPVAAKFLEKLPHCTLANTYGPTEATIHVTSQTVSTAELNGPLSIGRPLSHVAIYILDEGLQPVPIGVPGELMISGACLARGYIGRPELTEEKFLKNPFSSPGHADYEKMYRTGDLAAWSEDGCLQILGRVDHQVKVRGFRIELEEVESALAAVPGVSQATVVLKHDPSGDAHLVAYVAPEGLAADFLKGQMSQVLPYYMLPSLVLMLPELPLLPSGKVNRKGLPEPQWTAQGDKEYFPPRNALEQQIQKVWEDVLSLQNISIHADFFHLGGDSLKAGMVSAKLRQIFGVQVPGLLVFKFKTISSLSEMVKQVAGDNLDNLADLTRETPLGPAGFTDEQLEAGVPVSFNQCRMVGLHEADPQSTAYNIGVCLSLKGKPNLEAFERGAQYVVQRHEVLRMRYRRVEEDWQQYRVAEADALSLEYMDLMEAPTAQGLDSVLADNAVRPFDLFGGPLVRALVMKVKEDEFVWLICTHHVAFDGMSVMILAQEIAATYSAFANGTECGLLPLPLQYHDYAYWQRQSLMSSPPDVDYWVSQLKDMPAPFSMVPGLEAKAKTGSAPARGEAGVTIAKDLTTGLNKLALDNGATVYMTLLAGFSWMLSRASGESDIVIGCPFAAGRLREEVIQLVGYFVNPLPIRIKVDKSATFRDLLLATKDVVLSGFQHGQVPFHKMLQVTGTKYDAGVHPLYQTGLVLHEGVPDQGSMEIDGLSVEVMTNVAFQNHAKLDLGMELFEGDAGLRGTVEYNADKYGHEDVKGWIDSFLAILRAAREQPDTILEDLAGLMG